jgi:hypothetical protein
VGTGTSSVLGPSAIVKPEPTSSSSSDADVELVGEVRAPRVVRSRSSAAVAAPVSLPEEVNLDDSDIELVEDLSEPGQVCGPSITLPDFRCSNRLDADLIGITSLFNYCCCFHQLLMLIGKTSLFVCTFRLFAVCNRGVAFAGLVTHFWLCADAAEPAPPHQEGADGAAGAVAHAARAVAGQPGAAPTRRHPS